MTKKETRELEKQLAQAMKERYELKSKEGVEAAFKDILGIIRESVVKAKVEGTLESQSSESLPSPESGKKGRKKRS